jgi:peptide/nickel transport system substrate-binding protein
VRECNERPRRGWLPGFGLALSLMLGAACGDDESVSPTPGKPGADAGGVLRYGLDLTNTAGISLDPVRSNTFGDVLHMRLIYDTLVRIGGDGEFLPGLAVDWQIVDSHTIDLELRAGVRFHDGTPLDAAAVKRTIERNLAAHNMNHAPQLRAVASVALQGPLALRIHLSTPTAGAFFELLSGRETMPVSPAALDAGIDLDEYPVGAGPYRVTQLIPERVLRLERFEGHWEARDRKLAGIDFVHAPAGPSRVNALVSGDIDIANFAAAEVRAIQGRSELASTSRRSRSAFLYLGMCKSRPPFDDVRVRRALGHAIEREGLNLAVMEGLGEQGWMAWPSGSAYFAPELEGHLAYDPERARELLSEAGLGEGFSFEVLAPAFSPLFLHVAEVVQAQLRAIGVEVHIVTSSNVIKDLINVRAPLVAFGWVRPGLQKVTRMFGPNSVANFCQYSDPRIDGLTDRIAALPPDAPEVASLWHELEHLIAADALVHYLLFQPVVVAWSPTRVGGVTEVFDDGRGIDFSTVYRKP